MLYRNTIYNLLGFGLPLLAAVYCIPILINGLGTANFGILTLMWAIVSYLGILDMGIAKSLTQKLSPLISQSIPSENISKYVTSGFISLLLLGFTLSFLLYFFSTQVVDGIKGISNPNDVVNSVKWLSLSIFFVLLSNGLRAILEADNLFLKVNIVRIPLGIWTFAGPVLFFTIFGTLSSIAISLLIGRFLTFIWYLIYCCDLFKRFGVKITYSNEHTKLLIGSGGWMALSSCLSSALGYVDRFILAFFVSAVAVSFYAVPHEIVTKLWVVPAALSATLFPIFAVSVKDFSIKKIEIKSYLINFVLIVPLCLSLMFFSDFILEHWISKEFSLKSADVLIVLSMGMLIGSFAAIPFTMLQACGYEKIVAKIHLSEFFVFIIIIVIFTVNYGVLGAAYAWFLRSLVDCLLMFYFRKRLIHYVKI